MRWIIGISVGLALVVAVNIAFIVVAVTGADAVDPTYETERR
ncbi:MAG: hypothetical protein P3B98_12370 [Gemmatimonadota bacterium]|nr:hypothetical protein [Gemmatimonadota bacterium]